MKRAALVCCAVALAACLPGPETLVGDDNVELIVTGTRPGDRLSLQVGDDTFRRVARAEDVVRFFLRVEPGELVLSLRVERGANALCSSTDVVVGGDDDAPVVTSIDVADAAPCGAGPPAADAGPATDGGSFDDDDDGGPPGDDGGAPVRLLARLRETVLPTACAPPPCQPVATTTTLTGAGDLILQEGVGSAQSAEVADDVLQTTIDLALSADADALFASTSPPCAGGGAGPEDVQLERQVQIVRGDVVDVVVERVDASGCDTGVAADLRARLDEMRVDAFGPQP